MKRVIAVLIVVICPTFARAQDSVSHTTGGPMKTTLGFGIALNSKSSLQREWVIVRNQGALPADFTSTTGVDVAYEDKVYVYKASFAVEFKQPVSAVEIRFILFDVWGNRVKNLSMTEIEDYKPGVQNLSGKWRILTENEASEHYASIGYVARVRLADGKVLSADPRPVLEEAKKFSAKLTEADLEFEPKK